MIRTRAFNYIIAIIGILMLCSLDSSAQETYLETGGERKLNIVYKSVAQRDLLLDLYYPTSKNKVANPPYPVITPVTTGEESRPTSTRRETRLSNAPCDS